VPRLRFLERRKTDQFRRRQRYYRLLGPALILLLLIAGDARFLLGWDPYYDVGRPTRAVWVAGWFLFANFLVVRCLLHFWFQVKWVFLGQTLRHAPVFIVQAAVFALPFIAPMLALRGYRIHDAASFSRRFPACRYSRFVDRAPAAQVFEDTRYLYCVYGRERHGELALHFLRCRKGAQPKVREVRRQLLARLSRSMEGKSDEEQTRLLNEFKEVESRALRPYLADMVLATHKEDPAARLEFRLTRSGGIHVVYALKSDPHALFVFSSRDRGATWSDVAEATPALLKGARRPAARYIHVAAGEAFVAGEEGVSLSLRRPGQILESAGHVHLVCFRKRRLVYARFSKADETWWKPGESAAAAVDSLEKEVRAILARTGGLVPGLPGLTRAPSAPSSPLQRARNQARTLRRKAKSLLARLAEIEKEYGADKTKLELVEEKLFAIESALKEQRARRKAAPAAGRARARGLNAILQTMNHARDLLSGASDALETAGETIEVVEEDVDAARDRLNQNAKARSAFQRMLKTQIPKSIDTEARTVTGDQIRKAVRITMGWAEHIRDLEEKRRQTIIRVRGPSVARLREVDAGIRAAEVRLNLAEKTLRAVQDGISAQREHLRLPLLDLPAEGAIPEHGCTLYFASPRDSSSAGDTVYVRYTAPEEAGPGPAPSGGSEARTVRRYLRTRDGGDTWEPVPAAESPRVAWLSGRTFLFGTDSRGTDIMDRIIAGSRFYFTPAILGLALVACFALAAVMAFVGAVCETRVWWQYLFLRRLGRVLNNSIASVPAIIVLICVFVGLAARGSGKGGYDWAIVFAIVFTQIPNVYNYLYEAISRYKSSEMLAHDLGIGLSWFTIIGSKILRDRCLKIFLIQAFYILGYVILFETTLSYLGFAPPGDVDSWGKLMVEEGKLPMTRFLQTGRAGANDLVFIGPLALILITIYVTNRIGRLLTQSLIARGRSAHTG